MAGKGIAGRRVTTALVRYQRLEARGLWRDLPEAQRREVVVALGESSIVLTDPRSETALTHWSLPALRRTNPGQMPAVFVPGEDASESLEVDDADMVAALETVHDAIRAARRRPGRLRGTILGAALAGVVAAAVFLLPQALIDHTASVLPPATRTEIGRAALADLSRITGAPCSGVRGRAVLDRLSRRLFPDAAPVLLAVVREGVPTALHLPGDIVVLSESLLAEAEGPELFASHAVAGRIAAGLADPIRPLLGHAGPVATFRLLTSGSLPGGALRGYGEALLRLPQPIPPAEPLLEGFRAAGLSSQPFAFAMDPTGESVLALVEADPFPAGPPRPLMPDEDWVTLQDICTR